MTAFGARTILASAVVLATASPAWAQEGIWALVNVRIHPVSGPVIERGTIVIRNGLIAAVGAEVTAPADARVLDLSGREVAPGIIDLASAIGGSTAPAPGGRGQAGAAAQSPETIPAGLDPSLMATAGLKLSEADLRGAREAGITAILVAPGRGAFRGRSALIPTRASAGADQAIKAPASLQMGFEGVSGQYPSTLLGVIAYERQTLYDAQRYALVAERYRANPRGLARPEFNPGLEALVPAVRRELPVFFAASEENEIRRAVRIAGEFDLDLTVVGATEGFRALDALGGRTVVVSLNFPKASDVTGWSYRLTRSAELPDSAAADRAARAAIEGNAAALARAGVRFALGTGGARPGELLANVRKAIAAGLPREIALEALTIRPAQLLGLGEALGTIEVGKIANLVVTDRGDLLGDSSRVRDVFIDGEHYDVAPARPASRGAAMSAARLGGGWTMTINTPQGAQEVTMAVEQSGSEFSGSMTSMFGTTEFSDGQIDGRNVSWSMVLDMGGTSMTVTYQGEVDGTRMTGTATLGQFGTAPFTAEKRP
ncbi:MAG: amidohydrolase family protein [Gemmatimonadales bacterium]